MVFENVTFVVQVIYSLHREGRANVIVTITADKGAPFLGAMLGSQMSEKWNSESNQVYRPK